MNIEVVDRDGKVTLVRLHGRLDAPGADQIGIRFSGAVAAPGHDAAIDLSGVSFLASMGIRLLIENARSLHVKGAKLVLFGAQPGVADVLDQSAIDQIIPVVATESEALGLFGA